MCALSILGSERAMLPGDCSVTASEEIDWDDAYDNMGHIPGSREYPDRWTARATAFRGRWTSSTLEVKYGIRPRERFDLFHSVVGACGLVVFVHGGYWMRLDKSFWSDLAEGALSAGWAVALPSYSLAPEVRIAEITKQIATAIAAAAKGIPGPIRLVGHSAGGHLVARMVCQGGPLDPETASRIARVVSISGLHDLRPLMRTRMNAVLRIDAAEAISESPALLQPASRVRVTAWVGGGERPEFLRQARLLADAWPTADTYVDGNHDHFSVIDGLGRADAPIVRALLT